MFKEKKRIESNILKSNTLARLDKYCIRREIMPSLFGLLIARVISFTYLMT